MGAILSPQMLVTTGNQWSHYDKNVAHVIHMSVSLNL